MNRGEKRKGAGFLWIPVLLLIKVAQSLLSTLAFLFATGTGLCGIGVTVSCVIGAGLYGLDARIRGETHEG